MHGPSVFIETDKNKAIAFDLFKPHHTDERFKVEHSVFIDPASIILASGSKEIVEGASYLVLSEISGTEEELKAAWKVAKDLGLPTNSPASIEVYLQTALGDPDLRLVHIFTGVSPHNGYCYQSCGYISTKKQPAI